MQNDSAGFVNMVAYCAVVYSFIADVFVFDISFTGLEVAGVSVVAFFMFSIIFKGIYCKDR